MQFQGYGYKGVHLQEVGMMSATTKGILLALLMVLDLIEFVTSPFRGIVSADDGIDSFAAFSPYDMV